MQDSQGSVAQKNCVEKQKQQQKSPRALCAESTNSSELDIRQPSELAGLETKRLWVGTNQPSDTQISYSSISRMPGYLATSQGKEWVPHVSVPLT